MNKQEWSELTPEAQLKWWNTNAPDETAQFKTIGCFRKYVGDKGYFFLVRLNKWEEASSFNTLDEWKDGQFFVCEKPISKPSVPIGDTLDKLKKGVTPQAPYIPKVGEECEANLIGRPVFLCLPHCFSNGNVWYTEIREDKTHIDFVCAVSKIEFRPTITERQQRAIDLYPEQPYMPKVGEECEYMIDEGLWFPCFYIGFNSNGKCVIEKRTGCFEVLIANKFRSIKTEREKFIDDHKADVYLYAINTSELISMKQSTGEDLAARVLGYMHDAGFKSP
jgi:hypothetical protein